MVPTTKSFLQIKTPRCVLKDNSTSLGAGGRPQPRELPGQMGEGCLGQEVGAGRDSQGFSLLEFSFSLVPLLQSCSEVPGRAAWLWCFRCFWCF